MKPSKLLAVSITGLALVATALLGASLPAKGNALILGIKKGKTEIIIREVDGAVVGDLPFKPKYRHEVSAGTHKIQPFCTVHNDWGNELGPAVEIQQEFVDGHVYQLEFVGKEKKYIVKANDITPVKK